MDRVTELQKARIRQLHRQSRLHRQTAAAMFPIVVGQVAHDLREVLRASERPGGEKYLEMADYYENVIRDAYRDWFGAELGECASDAGTEE